LDKTFKFPDKLFEVNKNEINNQKTKQDLTIDKQDTSRSSCRSYVNESNKQDKFNKTNNLRVLSVDSKEVYNKSASSSMSYYNQNRKISKPKKTIKKSNTSLNILNVCDA